MQLADAQELSQTMIVTRCQNQHYDRVCHLADQYKALKTGENAKILLKPFTRREDDAAFAQRLLLTILITPAVTSALEKPFNKVSWNKKVKKDFDFKTPLRNATVDKMRESFYGRKKSKNKGLDYWLKTRYPALQFVDPNSWLVIEWDAPESQADVIKPRPFEVASCNAWDWEVENEDTKWLWVHQDINFNKLTKTAGIRKVQRIAEGFYKTNVGNKWTLYDEDYTLVYTQTDPEYLQSIGYVKAENETYWQDPISKDTFSVKVFIPNLSFAPAFRVGYAKDPETNGQTLVNGWHAAMPYLMKSVKTVSEMDLTMALHAFPQKMQYVQKCPGVAKKTCDAGKFPDGQTCSGCKGTGVKIHSSAQDALFFPFPDAGTTNAELLDLEKLLVYKAPPVDLLNFQNTYITGLKNDCQAAVFGQTQLTKVLGPKTQGVAPVTATEANDNIQGVYDALNPFTEKVADTWIEIINIFGLLAGTPQTEDVDITCVFPANPNIKSLSELLTDLQLAFASGAPAFLVDQINNEIAELLYEGDEIAERMYWTKHQFFPFNGQTPDEIALNIASTFVSKFTKVLYSNFESIFADIAMENVDFWFMTLDKQWPIVEAMVNEYIDEIETDMIPALSIGAQPEFSDNGAGDNGSPGEPVPGDPDYVDPVPGKPQAVPTPAPTQLIK